METMLEAVLKDYNLDNEALSLVPLKQGLINNTWKVGANGHSYILQKINNSVFKNPDDIANNLLLIDEYLQKRHKDYLFVAPIKTKSGDPLYRKGNDYFRVFPFVNGSHTRSTVTTPQQAYEAAKQFGKFTVMLKDFDSSQLRITIPSFHDLSLRYKQFIEAISAGNPGRIAETKDLIDQLKGWTDIAEEFDRIKEDKNFKLRVTHHDTKISNVLFDEEDKGICVIDLDTVMPGYFISDVGDMMRTYLSPANEEETDFSKIKVRPEIYDAILNGYLSEMGEELTETEKNHFLYSGLFMIYMQALRFLTDYLNNDAYYGASYPKQNFNRAKNQVVLLEKLLELKEEMGRADKKTT